MTWAWAAVLILANTVWLGATVFGLPGNWLMILGALLLAWAGPSPEGRAMFSPGVLVAITVLALAGEVLEFVAGAAGARQAGASGRGTFGAIAGALAGALAGTFLIPVPLVGSLAGAAAGACLGAVGCELWGGRPLARSFKAGLGAGAGRVVGTILKLLCGVFIWVLVALAALWP